MAGKIQHGIGQLGLVAISLGDQRARVVGHDELGYAAIKMQRLCGGAQPVTGRLRGCGRAIAIARNAQGGHKDVGAPDLLPPHGEWDGGAGKVNKQLLAGAVHLAHRALETFGKPAVVLAELRVAPGLDGIVWAVLVANLGAVFLPQQHEGHALAAQFLVDAPVVGLGVGVAGAG